MIFDRQSVCTTPAIETLSSDARLRYEIRLQPAIWRAKPSWGYVQCYYDDAEPYADMCALCSVL